MNSRERNVHVHVCCPKSSHACLVTVKAFSHVCCQKTADGAAACVCAVTYLLHVCVLLPSSLMCKGV